MFTPDHENGMPPLVSDSSPYPQQSPFIPPLNGPSPFMPPPQGASNGGHAQQGFLDAFPGASGGGGGGYGSSSPWVAPQGTPHPAFQGLPPPNSATSGYSPWHNPMSAPPLNSAHSWTYGAGGASPYGPPPGWGPPVSAHPPGSAPVAGWGTSQTPPSNYTPWDAHNPNNPTLTQHRTQQLQTPAGTWGAASPNSPWQPQTPGGGGGGGGWEHNNPWAAGGQSPYESAVVQPIAGGWGSAPAPTFGGGGGGDAGQGGWTWGPWGWTAPQPHEGERKRSKKKRRGSHGHYADGGLGHGHSLSMHVGRSNSHGPEHRPSLQRSASWGNSSPWYHGYADPHASANEPAPDYAQGDLFDENNLAKRPRDWRADYSARPGLSAFIPWVGKTRSAVKEYTDPVRRTLHSYLTYDPTSPPVYYDLRDTPFSPEDIHLLNLRRIHNPIDLAQLAVQPPCAFMRLVHPRLPWYIDIHQSNPNGVTIYDVFCQMQKQVGTRIHARHFWNDQLGAEGRAELGRAFDERTRVDREGLVRGGILQVDFFGEKCVFEGLVRGPRGMWEMKTRREEP